MSAPLALPIARPDDSPRVLTPWINGARWDLTWLTASAAVVPLVIVLVWCGASATFINLGVTAVVGGPHVWSTYLATYCDPRFRRSHVPLLLAAALLIPALVVWMTLVDFQLLLSIFIFAASIHVLQQNAFLTDIYRRRAGTPEPAWSRLVDYGVLGLSFYPIASYKLVHNSFHLGDVQILIPALAKTDATWMLVSSAFTALAVAWLAKTAWEYRRGVLNVPKTLLIAVTVTVAFLVPAAAAGERMELAFQAVNMWHCIQYLGIVWIVLKVRKERGLLDSAFVASVSGPGRATARFYGLCLLMTGAMLGVVFALVRFDPFRVRTDQYYYMCVLSVLLVHYALDGYLFTVSNRSVARFETIPFTAPAAA